MPSWHGRQVEPRWGRVRSPAFEPEGVYLKGLYYKELRMPDRGIETGTMVQ